MKHALEIGIGTGQATLPFLQTNCKIIAIEIGKKLTEYLRRKFASFSNFEVINIDFENFCADNKTFDLIYSAPAFHWTLEKVGYTKGYIALLNTYFDHRTLPKNIKIGLKNEIATVSKV